MKSTFFVSFASAVLLVGSAALLAPFGVHAATPTSFTGQLIELSSTTAPTTIVVRQNPTSSFTDYTVSISSQTVLSETMDAWITGDSLTVTGTQDDATGLVTAGSISNNSFDANTEQSLNGWVKAIDTTNDALTLTWQNADTTISVNAQTRIVVPPTNPAQLADVQVGDRIRVRASGTAAQPVAQIILDLRRGNQVFLMARTRPFSGTVVGVDASRSLFNVQLAADPALNATDVNNLVGVAGEIVSVTYASTTKFVASGGGPLTAADIGMGDGVFVIGRVGDDGVIGANVIQDAKPLAAGNPPFSGYTGVVTGWEPDEGVINLKLDATDATWTVLYTDSTKIYNGSTRLSALTVSIGDHVVVNGYQNRQLYTISPSAIAILPPVQRPVSPTAPLERIRPLADLIVDRIKTGLGQLSAADLLNQQPPASAEQTDTTATTSL